MEVILEEVYVEEEGAEEEDEEDGDDDDDTMGNRYLEAKVERIKSVSKIPRCRDEYNKRFLLLKGDSLTRARGGMID